MVRNKLAALAAAVTLLAAGSALAEAPYTDISGLASRDAIDYLYDTQCLTFIQGKQFEPNRLLTRNDLAVFLYNTIANLPLTTAATEGETPEQTLMALTSAGVLSGYSDGSFRPEEVVTREQFASVLYRYLQHNEMAEPDEKVEDYADANTIDPTYRTAIQVLHSKNLMVPADNYFRPKEGITRAEAAQALYQLLHSDTNYTSHVQIESQVIKALNAEYGSVPLFFRVGTMYWDKDTLVLGIKGAPSRYLQKRLDQDVSKPSAVKLRRVSLSHADYSQMMNSAIHCVVDNEGVQAYVGALPDYEKEQIVLTVTHPVSEKTLQELVKRVGSGRVRLETAAVAGQTVGVQVAGEKEEVASDDTEKGKNSRQVETKDLYSPLLDTATSSTITAVQRDAMN